MGLHKPPGMSNEDWGKSFDLPYPDKPESKILKTTNDFRLGNWVYDFAKQPIQIKSLTKPGATVLVTPIPIDKYWLGRMGFQMDEGVLHLIWQRDYGWQGIYYIKPWIVLTEGNVKGKRMNLGTFFYVHEIQNLYFGIRNKELAFDMNCQLSGDRLEEWSQLLAISPPQ